MRTFTWSPYDHGGLPPWMDRFEQPDFDECAAADAEQDAAAASPYAAALAERFGLLSAWRYEQHAAPPAEQQPAGLPPLDPDATRAIIARIVARRATADDDLTRMRRRHILERALEPADMTYHRDRRGRWAAA